MIWCLLVADDLDGVRVQAKAAKGLAADIKSWCRCFCDCFCCSKKPARPVRGRPAAQGADAAKRNAEERKAREKEEKRAAADRAKHGGDPEVPWHAPRHDAHLGALAADRLRQAQQDGAFSPEDVEVLEQETAKQEKALDAVAAAVDDLKHLARHMGEELDGQMPLVDEAVRKNEQAREGIRSIRL
ncbi:unnamed protein product [Pedinophyceae sp. YPF-701]|nr:unnamed protein product [Pedinophyceae sp. YPF-701]